MTTDVEDEDDEGDNASSTTCNEGDNHNRDSNEDACTLMAITPAHWRQQQHSQL